MTVYDDCHYCGACGMHSRDCWCWSPAMGRPDDEDPDEVRPGGQGHD